MSKRKLSGGPDLSSFLPSSFGKAAKDEPTARLDAALEQTRKKKVIPATYAPKEIAPEKPDPIYVFGVNMPPEKKEDKSEQIDREVEELDEANPFGIPYSHEVELKGHQSHVSALTLDPKGARLISGSYDSHILLWDFNAMDERFKSFRTLEPETDVITSITYNSTGSQFILASNSPQSKIFDRDGKQLVEFPKGYPYVQNMAETKGHIAKVTSAFFHPTNKEIAITSSRDCTIRMWDINSYKKHKDIIKVRNAQGGVKSAVLKSCIDREGKNIAAVCEDGSLQIFSYSGPHTKSIMRFERAHLLGSETSSVVYASDGIRLLTRGGDDTMKLWDLRALGKGPIKSFENLPNKYAETSVVFSPDENVAVTGTSTIRDTGDVGKLAFFDLKGLEEIKQVSVTSGSVVSVLWHKELNQIICGCTDKNIHLLYNPTLSKKGVMLCLTKHPKKERPEDSVAPLNIQNPHALPLFKAPTSTRRQREKAQMDPTKACLPQAPQIGPGFGGRVGISATASIMKDLVQKTPFDPDPRAALLKYARPEDYAPAPEPKKKKQKKEPEPEPEDDE